MNAHQVACPACKASAGFPCVWITGGTMRDDVHPSRTELYTASKQLMETLGK